MKGQLRRLWVARWAPRRLAAGQRYHSQEEGWKTGSGAWWKNDERSECRSLSAHLSETYRLKLATKTMLWIGHGRFRGNSRGAASLSGCPRPKKMMIHAAFVSAKQQRQTACMTQILRRLQGLRPTRVLARGKTHHSPPADPLPSVLPPLASRAAFWPAAAEAKLDGRLDGMFWTIPTGRDRVPRRGVIVVRSSSAVGRATEKKWQDADTSGWMSSKGKNSKFCYD